MYYLHSRLSEFSHLGQLFSGVNIRVMGSFESLLQFFQLLGRKRGTTSALLPLEGEVRLRLHIRRFIHSTACSKTFTFTVTLCCHSSFTILLPPPKKGKKEMSKEFNWGDNWWTVWKWFYICFIHHVILIQSLTGVSDTSQDCFKSQPFHAWTSVPQGSVLSPFLLIIWLLEIKSLGLMTKQCMVE